MGSMKNKKKIFILEDSYIQRIQIAEDLKQEDREIILAETVAEAKEKYDMNKHEIDLFIIDLKLPDGEGIDFLKYVRESVDFTPSIIVSGLISQEIQQNGGDLCIVSIFEKPIQPYGFSKTVGMLLQ